MPEFVSEPQRWVIPAVLLVALVGGLLAVWWERRRPSSYTRRVGAMAAWESMSSAAQAAHDNTVLEAAEAAEVVSARMAEAAKRNALFHP